MGSCRVSRRANPYRRRAGKYALPIHSSYRSLHDIRYSFDSSFPCPIPAIQEEVLRQIRRRTSSCMMLILLSCAERIACRFVIRSRSVTTDFDRLCRTGSAVLIDAGHDRTGDAVTITTRFRIVRKRRIDRLVKERRTARLTFLLCHTAANIDPVCIASPCRIM